MLAGALDDDAKVKIIANCAYEAAKHWMLDGALARPDTVDELIDMAVCVGLVDSMGREELERSMAKRSKQRRRISARA
jgi:hypothetical protein